MPFFETQVIVVTRLYHPILQLMAVHIRASF
ncbi:hypothetical protein VIAG107301_16400 [Vibrio agarivorans]